jgi:hypothetical protein
MKYVHWLLLALVLPCLTTLSNCGAYGRGLGGFARRPAPSSEVTPTLRAQYTANAQVNAKIRAFVRPRRISGV